jgi:chromosome segregation protein
MFLRSLSIRGFKSFADKTVLDFAPGIGVIVGPNGSGKSNLVDAISWVLGEQGPRALRGSQMADVIFAGSPQRAQLGMAEVKLVIDNSAGLIAVPMTEIEISRAIFRNGDSEYRIGGQLCRLLDVQELLSESGIGRALHTVVGQGQLEDVLTARPEERRQYIEEAAGIGKHRKRRERSERKLTGLDQDLLRLQDVLTELKRQLKPLKHQAEMARRHEDLTAEADSIAVRLAAARLRDLLADRDRRAVGWDDGLARRRAARERLDALDADVTATAEARERSADELSDAEARYRVAETERSAAQQALRGAVEAEAQARAEVATRATHDARLAVLDEDLQRIEARIVEVATELEDREDDLGRAEAAFRRAQEERRVAEEDRHRIHERAAAHRAEIETLRRSLDGYERERARLDEQLAAALERRCAAEAERDRLSEETERLDADVAPLLERRAGLGRERHSLADGVAELQDVLRRHETRRDVLEARRADLEETAGSRFVERHPGRSLGLLGELVEVEAGWERALDAALGSFADAVVYERELDAVADAPEGEGAVLAVAGGGPAAFVIEGERTLLSLVTVDGSARGLICTLLKDVYLASSVQDAVAKRRIHPKAAFVTLEGVLIGQAVIRTAPAEDVRARQIARELLFAEHDLALTKASLRPKRERLEAIFGEIGELTNLIDQADAAITRAAERIAALGSEIASAAKEQEILEQRLAGLEDASAAWRSALAAAEPITVEVPELPRIGEPPIEHRVAVETLRRDRSSLDARRAAVLRERGALVARDPDAARQTLAAAQARVADAERAADEAESRYADASDRRREAAERQRTFTEAEAVVNRAWRDASTELDRLREAYEDEDRARGELERRIRDAQRLLREGHACDPMEAVGSLEAEDTVQSLEKRAELVQRRLALLGRVNLLAGGEFEALQERHDFLARELDDVKKARRDLIEVIQRIDAEIATTFESAYRDVAEEFGRLFKELFPGGEGRIVATEPGDLLNTGIEIEARPGRKRVRRISLLSGGERALTAMSFLFSIFKARPSPFYLMDEVEPALDDVNLHRFLRLVRGFSADSQVLIVTHQKRTMEVAQMLYGVSMSPDGTTRVVAQSLDSAGPGIDPTIVSTQEPLARSDRAAMSETYRVH